MNVISGKQFVYIVKCENYIKIGTTNNYKVRLGHIQSHNPFKLEVLAIIVLENETDGYLLESELHKMFSDKRIRGEWFLFDPMVLEHIRQKHKSKIINYEIIDSVFKERSKIDNFIKRSSDRIKKLNSLEVSDYINTREAAALLKVTDRTIRRKIEGLSDSDMEYLRVNGKKTLIDKRFVLSNFQQIQEKIAKQ